MYTLTQEQVNELVKGKSIQEVLPEAFKLEVGKWYKDPFFPLRLIFVEELIQPKGNSAIKGYGPDGSGQWKVYSNGFYAGAHDLYLATREEVESMLIAEAKKRGFVEGAKVKGLDVFSGVLSLGKCVGNDSGYFYDSVLNWLVANITPKQNATIFKNGKWATIVPESKADILTELIDYARINDNLWLKNQLEKLR